MNKHAVKQLTKEGCIVGREAAEALTEEDIEAIKRLDTPPMYITEDMLSKLRQKAASEHVSNGGTVVKQKPGKAEETEKAVSANVSGDKGSQSSENISESNSVPDKKKSESNTEKEEVPEDKNGSGEKGQSEKLEPAETSSKKVEIMDDRDRKDIRTKVEIMDEKNISREEKDVPEFLQYYNDRYKKMKKLLTQRMELQSATTINRLERRNKGEQATTVGMVKSKYSTNSGKYIIELEDNTGSFKALLNERDGERVVPDEVIGVIGSMGGDIIYADSVVRPDMPIPQGVNTTKDKVEAAYISDLHIGSKDTLHGKLDKFAEWLGSKKAEHVRYLVITGDLVEGVGTYPGQEDELETTDIYKQYARFEDWVEKVPEDIQIIAGPGNHDITRLAEPQPRLPEKAFPRINDFNNFHRVQNPQTVKLHGINGKGIVNLMYHGHSFDGHADQIRDLREKAYDEPEHLMIDLLKRRHLAPTYGTNSLSPEEEDGLVINHEPDVFVSGHFHAHCNESYKGVNVINSSTFQGQTEFQKRMGHEPKPGLVTLVNYKNRNTRVKKF